MLYCYQVPIKYINGQVVYDYIYTTEKRDDAYLIWVMCNDTK